jgi:hypothetical protein
LFTAFDLAEISQRSVHLFLRGSLFWEQILAERKCECLFALKGGLMLINESISCGFWSVVLPSFFMGLFLMRPLLCAAGEFVAQTNKNSRPGLAGDDWQRGRAERWSRFKRAPNQFEKCAEKRSSTARKTLRDRGTGIFFGDGFALWLGAPFYFGLEWIYVPNQLKAPLWIPLGSGFSQISTWNCRMGTPHLIAEVQI